MGQGGGRGVRRVAAGCFFRWRLARLVLCCSVFISSPSSACWIQRAKLGRGAGRTITVDTSTGWRRCGQKPRLVWFASSVNCDPALSLCLENRPEACSREVQLRPQEHCSVLRWCAPWYIKVAL